jgi:hypothetical protein
MNNDAQIIKSDLHYVGPYVYIVVQAIHGLRIFGFTYLVSRHLVGLWSKDQGIKPSQGLCLRGVWKGGKNRYTSMS